jgi:tRNA-specific adenosine deaminase 1
MKQLDLDQTWEQRISNETKKRKFHSIDSDIKDKNRDIHDRSFLHGVVRGRNEYHALGQLRTKPGRIDSEPSLAMSCSDKIAKWNRLGLNGALLSLFLPPIRLAGIIIGDYYDYDELHRSLNTRVGTAVPIFHTTIRFPLSKSNCQGKPIPCSLSWNCHDKSQIIVNGKKQGAKEINSKTSPLISKYHLAKLFMSVYGEHHISYSNIKKQATHYQQEKKVLYSSRNFCDWICASPESFFIDE